MQSEERFNTDSLQRISALEAGQDRLSRDVTHLADAIEQQGRETSKSFKDLSDKFSQGQKTHWPTIIAALTLIVLIIGGVLSGYLRDLNRLEKKQENSESMYLKHMFSEGHSGVKINRHRINQLELKQ